MADVLAGLLSKQTSFRLIVDGPYELCEVTNLIAVLQVYKRILEGEQISLPDHTPQDGADKATHDGESK